MGDLLNLGFTPEQLGYTPEELDTVAPDSEHFISRLVNGGTYLARIDGVEEKLSDNNGKRSIGLNVAVSVMVNPDAGVFSADATHEKISFNYIWIGDNVGTMEAPVLSLRDGKPSGFLTSFIGGVGVQNLVSEGKLDLKRAEGLIVRVMVKHEEYQGNVNAKVSRWLGCVDNSAVLNRTTDTTVNF